MTARVVIAGTSSGVGKTTVACGLIGALRARGLRVQGFKVGPDFIDPSYHALASGRPGRNLDAFLSGPELIGPLFRHGARDADVAVIEGVMGLFDGASGSGELASTAHIAKLLDAPVLLVVDASAMARSVAAIVYGFRSFDPGLSIAGVLLNQVGSDGHERLLREALAPLEIPVLGALHRDADMAAPERHLGLVPAGERVTEARHVLERLASVVAGRVDLAALLDLARAVPPVPGSGEWSPDPAGAPAVGARVAVARGPAFSFYYQENLELLGSAGAELCEFDPLSEGKLPDDAGGLVLAGGFPEVFVEELATNKPLRGAIATFVHGGRPVLAECGGLLYLCAEFDGHEMCGVIPARAQMTARLTLGYREATATTESLYGVRGNRVRGHEFHYSTVDPLHGEKAAWTLPGRGNQWDEGFATPSLHASYLHVHWAAYPDVALRFAHAASPAQESARDSTVQHFPEWARHHSL